MSFLQCPVKRSSDVDLIRPLSKFIQETYGDDQERNHKQALEDFNNLRAKALNKLSDRHESAIQILNQYYDQLLSVETKIPMAENAVRVEFKWQDAFDKESLFAGRNILKLQSSAFERIAILFNIAAVSSQVAADSANEGDDTGLKSAAKYFQQSAGLFSYLKSLAPSVIQRGATPDLTGDCLTALSALMLAQAQDCIFLKAARDKMKPGIVAKIAQQASELYAQAKTHLSLNSMKNLWPKDWLTVVSMKQNAFQGLAQFFQGNFCGEAHSFGEQIGRYKYAEQLLKSAAQKAGPAFLYPDYVERVKRSLADAEKDNNLIYHETVPDAKALAPIERAVLAKEAQPQFPLCAKGTQTDAFERLVPVAMHNAMLTFDACKQQAANFEIGRLREATDVANSVLASLNLPASLEDDKACDVPASLLEKASRIRQAGGIKVLQDMIDNLPDMLQRNCDLLKEAKGQLDEEQESDDRLRNQFGEERWRRTPSVKLTEPWRQEIGKYQAILDQAVKSDGVVKERFEKQAEAIRLMSQSDADIKKALPQGSTDGSVSSSQKSAKQELKKLCERVEEIKVQRKQLEEEMQNAKPERLTALFSGSTSNDGVIPADQISQEEVNKLFVPLREKAAASMRDQEAVLAQIQQRNQEFVGGHATGGGSTQRRAELLSNLATAYDQFEQLRANMQEGSKFYGDMTELLMKFQNKVSDFVFARKTEKEEMMKDLQVNMTQQKSEMPKPAESSKAAPPRPAVPPASNPHAQQQQTPYQPGAPAPSAYAPYSPPPQMPYAGMPSIPPGYLPYPTSYGGGMPQPQPYLPGAPPPAPYYQPYGGYGGYPMQGAPPQWPPR